MLHAAHAPAARLAPFVQSLWIQEEPATPAGEWVEPTVLLPVGYAALVLDHGEPFEELAPDGTVRRLAPLALAGPFTRPVRVRATGRTALVIVAFRPWGANAFFGPQAECAERFVELDLLLPAAEVRRLREELHAAPDARGRCAAVERFLGAQRNVRTPDARVVAAVARIERRAGHEPIEALADGLGLGRRHLARLFERSLGMGPKTFARIVRFQHLLRRARAGESWATLAPAAGFSDQAHLVKECVALAGCTPTALLGGLEQHEVGRYFNAADASLRRSTIYL